MGIQVVSGAILKCSFGIAPSVLNVIPMARKIVGGMPAANIMDHKPIVNIPPFGMCQSMANPTVAGATAAKLGVFTPSACIPNTPAPWMPGSPTVLIGNMPALNNASKCMCVWGGIIETVLPGQFQDMIP